MIDDRIAERRADVRADRRRHRLRRTLRVVALVLVAVALVAVERSPLVGLEEVRVRGVEELAASQVREAAGLELGTSTLRLGLSAATERVEELALVRSARVHRVDPLTVEVQVIERRPVLRATDGDVVRLVDRDGVVILEDGGGDLVEVRLAQPPPQVGATVVELPALANAYRVWRGLSGPLRARVDAYEATGVEELELDLDSGVRVRFGRAERVDEKVRALGAVLEDVGDTPIDMVDVRAPGAPVVVGR